MPWLLTRVLRAPVERMILIPSSAAFLCRRQNMWLRTWLPKITTAKSKITNEPAAFVPIHSIGPWNIDDFQTTRIELCWVRIVKEKVRRRTHAHAPPPTRRRAPHADARAHAMLQYRRLLEDDNAKITLSDSVIVNNAEWIWYPTTHGGKSYRLTQRLVNNLQFQFHDRDDSRTPSTQIHDNTQFLAINGLTAA